MAEHNQQFNNHDQWVNKASSWLTRHPEYRPQGHHDEFRTICFDTKGRICRNGRDFARAHDEETFPVRWFWPDQVGPLAIAAEELCKACEDEMTGPCTEEEPGRCSDDEGVSTSLKDGKPVDSPITFGMLRRLRDRLSGVYTHE